MELGKFLEMCDFASFWEKQNEQTKEIKDFEEQIKEYILKIIKLTFQTIPIEQFSVFVNIKTDSPSFDSLLTLHSKSIINFQI